MLGWLIPLYFDRAPSRVADAAWQDAVAAGLDAIAFAWAGGDERGDGHYYVMGRPTFLVEYETREMAPPHPLRVARPATRLRRGSSSAALRHWARLTPHSISPQTRRALDTPRAEPGGQCPPACLYWLTTACGIRPRDGMATLLVPAHSRSWVMSKSRFSPAPLVDGVPLRRDERADEEAGLAALMKRASDFRNAVAFLLLRSISYVVPSRPKGTVSAALLPSKSSINVSVTSRATANLAFSRRKPSAYCGAVARQPQLHGGPVRPPVTPVAAIELRPTRFCVYRGIVVSRDGGNAFPRPHGFPEVNSEPDPLRDA